MTATAHDYTWFSERFPRLARAYCLTLVRDLAPALLLDRVGVRQPVERTGIERLVSAAYKLWEVDPTDRFLVGATVVGDWTVLVEPNGFLGVTHRVSLPLSRGTRLVSHFRTADALDQFCWVENGDTRLRFEPSMPGERSGSDPDGLVEVLRQVGFGPDAIGAEPELVTGAAFALAEHLTGVRLTAELLETASYSCGAAPAPPGSPYG